MNRLRSWWSRPRHAESPARSLARDSRGGSMTEYVVIVGLVSLVAGGAFMKLDGAVRTALKSEPEKTAKLDGDDGERNGPTPAEIAEAVAYTLANDVAGGERDKDIADRIGGQGNGGDKGPPPANGSTRGDPGGGRGGSAATGGGSTTGGTTPASTTGGTRGGATNGGVSNGSSNGGNANGGTPNGGTPNAGTPNGGTPNGGTPNAGTPNGGTPNGGTPNGGTPNGGTPNAGTSNGGTPNGGTPNGGTPNGGTPNGNNPNGGTPNGNNPNGGSPNGNNPNGNGPSAGTSNGNNPNGGAPNGNNPSGGTPGGNNPNGGASNGNNPSGNGTSAGTPSGNSPNGGTPNGNNPNGNNPSGGTPTGNSPNGNGPIAGKPGGNTPNGNNPSGNSPNGNNPSGNNPNGNNPSGNNPNGNNPNGGSTTGGNPNGNNPNGSNPNGNTPNGGTAVGSTPNGGVNGGLNSGSSGGSRSNDDNGGGSPRGNPGGSRSAGSPTSASNNGNASNGTTTGSTTSALSGGSASGSHNNGSTTSGSATGSASRGPTRGDSTSGQKSGPAANGRNNPNEKANPSDKSNANIKSSPDDKSNPNDKANPNDPANPNANGIAYGNPISGSSTNGKPGTSDKPGSLAGPNTVGNPSSNANGTPSASTSKAAPKDSEGPSSLEKSVDDALKGDRIGDAYDTLADSTNGKPLPSDKAPSCAGGRCSGDDGSNCFVAGTPVLTASGPRAIDEIREGDVVVSKDDATGEVSLRPVTRVFARVGAALVEIEIHAPEGAVDAIRSTPEHPYWSIGRGWVAAGRLRIGERLLDARGGELAVVRVTPIDAQAPVYNFEVDATHTYFAGALGAWVHNMCKKGSDYYGDGKPFKYDAPGAVTPEKVAEADKKLTEDGFDFVGYHGTHTNVAEILVNGPNDGVKPSDFGNSQWTGTYVSDDPSVSAGYAYPNGKKPGKIVRVYVPRKDADGKLHHYPEDITHAESDPNLPADVKEGKGDYVISGSDLNAGNEIVISESLANKGVFIPSTHTTNDMQQLVPSNNEPKTPSIVAKSTNDPPADGSPSCTGPGCKGAGSSCFVAGTPVLTASGTRAIEQIHEGDDVVSRDEVTGEVSVRPVVHVFARLAASLVDVEVLSPEGSGDTIRSTPEHPYWSRERGWTAAGELRVGERLLDARGAELAVASVVSIAAQAPVYNFEVGGTHSYFAGAARVWVHNACEKMLASFKDKYRPGDLIYGIGPLRVSPGQKVDENKDSPNSISRPTDRTEPLTAITVDDMVNATWDVDARFFLPMQGNKSWPKNVDAFTPAPDDAKALRAAKFDQPSKDKIVDFEGFVNRKDPATGKTYHPKDAVNDWYHEQRDKHGTRTFPFGKKDRSKDDLVAVRGGSPWDKEGQRIAFSKTSKAGLDFQINQTPTGQVHFFLSGPTSSGKVMEMSTDDAAKKDGPGGGSVTEHELRWVYRHKDDPGVKDRVIFWGKDGEIPLDKVFGSDAWKEYGKNRQDKKDAEAATKAEDAKKAAEKEAKKNEGGPWPWNRKDKDTSKSNAPACTGAGCSGADKCFVAGTPVMTASGKRPIEEIHVGDEVLSRDDATGELSVRPVTQVFAHVATSLVDVAVATPTGDAETIRSTPDHPYWSLEHGWTAAVSLHAGERLVDATGGELVVVKVLPVDAHARVFNFAVAGTHTYFAGASRAWVHNTCDGEGSDPKSTKDPNHVVAGSWLSKARDLAQSPNPADALRAAVPSWKAKIAELHAAPSTSTDTRPSALAASYQRALGQVAAHALASSGRPAKTGAEADAERAKIDAWTRGEPAPEVEAAVAKMNDTDATRAIVRLELDTVWHPATDGTSRVNAAPKDDAAQDDSDSESYYSADSELADESDNESFYSAGSDLDDDGDDAAEPSPPGSAPRPPTPSISLAGDPDPSAPTRPIDAVFLGELSKTPMKDNAYKAWTYGGKPALTVVGLAVPGAIVITGPVGAGVTGVAASARYAHAQPKLKAKLDALHEARDAIPPGREHDRARAAANYAISQTTRQLDRYYEDTTNTVANSAVGQIPVVGTALSGANTARRTIPDLAHTARKYKGGDLSSERKAGARILLDEAYLNDSPHAQKVMETYYGKPGADKIGQEWKKIHEGQLRMDANLGATGTALPGSKQWAKQQEFVGKWSHVVPTRVAHEQPSTNRVAAAVTSRIIPPEKVTWKLDAAVLNRPATPAEPRVKSRPIKEYPNEQIAAELGPRFTQPKSFFGKTGNATNNTLGGMIPGNKGYKGPPDKPIVDATKGRLSARPNPLKKPQVSPEEAAASADGPSSTRDAPSESPACTGASCSGGDRCFVAGTPIATASGKLPIEEIHVGDEVLSRDDTTGEVSIRPVTQVFAHVATGLVDVAVLAPTGAAETIRSTPEHPYWSLEHGWTAAGSLHAGERLVDAKGGELVVAKVLPVDAQALVYNFAVAGTHTYFAGASGAWVHNSCKMLDEFHDAFAPGDLIYGITDLRGKPTERLDRDHGLPNRNTQGNHPDGTKLQAVFVDDFVNSIISTQDRWGTFYDAVDAGGVWPKGKPLYTDAPAYQKDSYNDSSQQSIAGFKKFIEEKKGKYDPNETGNKFVKKEQKTLSDIARRDDSVAMQEQFKKVDVAVFSKTSKAGIAYQIEKTNHKVHFFVAGPVEKNGTTTTVAMDTDKAAKKTDGPDDSVTNHELRWVFRNKDDPRVKERVVLWNDKGRVDFDTVFGTDAWKKYAKERQDKNSNSGWFGGWGASWFGTGTTSSLERAASEAAPACTGPGCDKEGGNCFVAGTMIATPVGLRAIETVKLGDIVLARAAARAPSDAAASRPDAQPPSGGMILDRLRQIRPFPALARPMQ